MSDNPPAFPADQHGDSYHIGMSLRDYFAGQALSCLVGAPDHTVEPAEGNTHQMAYAKLAYSLADAMLAERENAS